MPQKTKTGAGLTPDASGTARQAGTPTDGDASDANPRRQRFRHPSSHVARSALRLPRPGDAPLIVGPNAVSAIDLGDGRYMHEIRAVG